MNDFLRVFDFVEKLKAKSAKINDVEDKHDKLVANWKNYRKQKANEHEHVFHGAEENE